MRIFLATFFFFLATTAQAEDGREHFKNFMTELVPLTDDDSRSSNLFFGKYADLVALSYVYGPNLDAEDNKEIARLSTAAKGFFNEHFLGGIQNGSQYRILNVTEKDPKLSEFFCAALQYSVVSRRLFLNSQLKELIEQSQLINSELNEQLKITETHVLKMKEAAQSIKDYTAKLLSEGAEKADDTLIDKRVKFASLERELKKLDDASDRISDRKANLTSRRASMEQQLEYFEGIAEKKDSCKVFRIVSFYNDKPQQGLFISGIGDMVRVLAFENLARKKSFFDLRREIGDQGFDALIAALE